MRPLLYVLGVLLLVGSFAGCGDPEPPLPPRPPAADLVAAWQQRVAEKDTLMRSPRSPLTPELQAAFTGIPHYPYDTTLALPVRLTPRFQPDTVTLRTSTGTVERYATLGTFSFRLDGTAYTLTAFRPVRPGPRYLFVPFRDATAGSETYPAGRYLELTENATGDAYLLDFNDAITPYCAYNPRYVCPVPPPENTLAVPIRAGEKVLHGDDVTR